MGRFEEEYGLCILVRGLAKLTAPELRALELGCRFVGPGGVPEYATVARFMEGRVSRQTARATYLAALAKVSAMMAP